MALSRGNSLYVEGAAGVAAGSLDCGSDTNRMLFVGIWKGNSAALVSVIYGIQSMTLLGEQTLSGSAETLYVYGLVAPATGSNTLTVTYTAGPSLQFRATNYAGVGNQTLPTGDAIKINTGTSITSLTVNPVSVGANSWGFCQARSLAGNIQDGTNMTLIAALSHDGIASLDTNGNLGSAGTETLQIGASASGTMGMVAVVFSESAVAIEKTVSDTLTLTTDRAVSLARAVSDTLTLTTDRVISLARAVIDALTLTTVIVTGFAFAKTVMDTLNLTTAVQKLLNGASTIWTALAKATTTWTNRVKAATDWINRDKSS